MTKSRILVCSLVLLLAPDALPGQPSGALIARPEHLRAASDIAAKFVFRLTPRNPVALAAGALPTDDPIGWLILQRPWQVRTYGASGTQEGQEGRAEFLIGTGPGTSGGLRIFALLPEPDEPYVLEVLALSDVPGSYFLRNQTAALAQCLVNFQYAGDQVFEDTQGGNLRILVERPLQATMCQFEMWFNPLQTPEGIESWRFYHVELREP